MEKHRFHILVITDDYELSTFLNLELSEDNQVVCLSSDQQPLGKASALFPSINLIILGLNSRNSSGLALLEKLKHHPYTEHVPKIIFANLGKEFAKKTKALGIKAVFPQNQKGWVRFQSFIKTMRDNLKK